MPEKFINLIKKNYVWRVKQQVDIGYNIIYNI
jgi:hypothetical protein